MKKTFTILAIATLFTTATFAQNYDRTNAGYGNAAFNNPNHGYGNDDRGGFFGEREKDMLIARINHEYNERIESVKENFFMRWSKKQRIIESLQCQRDQEIHEVMEKFYHSGYHHWDRDDHDRRNW